MNKKWIVASHLSSITDELSEYDPMVRTLLLTRNINTDEAARRFLEPVFARDLHDPFLFKDMDKIMERVLRARVKKERITVHGDYDADGVTSAAIMAYTLEHLGLTVEVYLPHRETDGYGLKNKTVQTLAAQGTRVLITVDCGVTSREEVALARSLGMDVIILDHHLVQDELFPHNAYALLHPRVQGESYPFEELTAGGIAFKFAQAVAIRAHDGFFGETVRKAFPLGWEKWLLDLAAISTVADVAPLIGENRTLVHFGLKVLEKTRNQGLRALMDNARVRRTGGTRPLSLDAKSIGFQIAPRLNAAGRMAHAELAFRLLRADKVETALALAKTLEQANSARQRLVERILDEAREKISREENNHAIVVTGEGWPASVMGLVAGKLKDEFWRPAFALGTKNGVAVGSGRSIDEVHMLDFLHAVNRASDSVASFGGHRMACGLTIDGEQNLIRFTSAVHDVARNFLDGKELAPSLHIDATIDLKGINSSLARSLYDFEPFGEGNERPRFLLSRVSLTALERVGSDGKHTRLRLSNGIHSEWAIYFSAGERVTGSFRLNDTVDVVVEIRIDEWRGEGQCEIRVVDIRPSA